MTGWRIGHVVSSWPQQGGVADVIKALVANAAEQGDTAEIFAWPDGHGKFGALTRLRHLPPGLRAALPTLDALVLHGVFTPGLALLSRQVRRLMPGLRLVAFPHDAYDAGLFSSGHVAKRLYWKAIERRYLSGVDVIQVTAPSHAGWLVENGVSTPIEMRPLGIPAMATRTSSVPLSPAAPDGAARLLFVGRWDIHEKGLDLLIGALGSSAQLRSGWRLRLVGPEVGARQQLVELASRADIDIELVGWVDDLRSEFLNADALILPSRKEGFGLVALQALSLDLPVILSKVAGLTEHLQVGTGWLPTAPTAASIRCVLEQALNQRAILIDQVRAADFAGLEHFSWPRLHAGLLGR